MVLFFFVVVLLVLIFPDNLCTEFSGSQCVCSVSSLSVGLVFAVGECLGVVGDLDYPCCFLAHGFNSTDFNYE